MFNIVPPVIPIVTVMHLRTYLINVDGESGTVRKTVSIAACCAHIEVPRLTTSWQKTNLSHKTHDPGKNLAGFQENALFDAFFHHLPLISQTQPSMINSDARSNIFNSHFTLRTEATPGLHQTLGPKHRRLAPHIFIRERITFDIEKNPLLV